MKRHVSLLTSFVFVAATAWVQAQAPAPKPAPAPKSTTHGEDQTHAAGATSDQAFAQKVAAGGASEVELAMLAQQKASAEEVKSLASRLETDHSKANDELKKLAMQKGWTLPAGPTADQKAKKEKLEKLSGAAFDKEYVNLMVTNHHNGIADFQREASRGSDADLKQFASSTLPTLKEHLDMAQKAQKNLSGHNTSSSDKGAYGKGSSTKGSSTTGSSNK